MTPEDVEIQKLRREVRALRALKEENEMLRLWRKLDMSEISRLRRQIEAMEEERE